MTRLSASFSLIAAALALALGACDLDSTEKMGCAQPSDCLEGFQCVDSECIPEAEAPDPIPENMTLEQFADGFANRYCDMFEECCYGPPSEYGGMEGCKLTLAQ